MQAMNSVATGSGVQGPVGQLEKWSVSSRRVEAEILRHLSEVDVQGGWADAANSSLAAYCMGRLGYSEQMAYKRIRVARLSRGIPGILQAVAEGRATVCGLCTVASLVTVENAGDWMAKIAGKTKREVEALAALARVEAGRPAPAPRNTLRALPKRPAPAGASAPPAPTLLLPPNSPRVGHSLHGYQGEARAGAGAVASCSAERRPCDDLGPRAGRAHRSYGVATVWRRREAQGCEHVDSPRNSPHWHPGASPESRDPRNGATSGVRARRWGVCVRRRRG
jgi:hypothetical protein